MKDSSPPPTTASRPRPLANASYLSTASTMSTSSFQHSAAPTPNNTYIGPDNGDIFISSTFDPTSSQAANLDRMDHDVDDSFHSENQEILYDNSPYGGGGGYHSRDYTNRHLSLQPSISPSSSADHLHVSIHSSQASARLLPYTSTPIESAIPISNRPIPAPPLHLRSYASRQSGNSTNTNPPMTPDEASITSPSVTIDTNLPSGNGSTTTSSASTHPPLQQHKGLRWRSSKVTPIDPDAQRLRQLGYDPVLGRDYTFWSSLAISWLNVGALQGTIYAVSGTYIYGGPMMILIAWPLSGILSLPLTLTMAELASAYPVSGAMASWAWKCARGGIRGEREWGWLMGGVVLGGHIGNLILVAWETTNVIVGTMGLSFDFQSQAWQEVLFFLAIVTVVGLVGSQAWGRSPRYWTVAGLYGGSVWLILCIILLATSVARGHYSSTSWADKYYNSTGWSSRGYVYLLGWQYCTIATGADASAHMSEETQNPSRNVPNAMTFSMILTYVLGYVAIVLLLLSINPDDAAVLATHVFPVGYILEKATSRPGAIAICCLLIGALLLQLQAQLQAASRFLFALGRDQAFPFSRLIQRTNSSKQPSTANWIVVALWAPSAFLLFGSATALYSVLAVTASSLSMLSYVVPVALYLLSKVNLQNEARMSWSLRKWSRPIGVLGVLYGALVVVSQTLPGHKPVTASNMSWSPVVIAGTIIVCYITWKCYGDRHYSGPIRSLTKWETGVEIDLESTLATRASRNTAGLADAFDKSNSSIKLGNESMHECPYGTNATHTVTIESAPTVESGSGGEWAGMNSVGFYFGDGTVEERSTGNGSGISGQTEMGMVSQSQSEWTDATASTMSSGSTVIRDSRRIPHESVPESQDRS